MSLFLASLLRVLALASNVSRTREVVKPANRVVSAKIEFLRENQTRRNRKPTISRDRCWQMAD